MEADYFIGVAQQSLWILALASAPLLLPVLVIGVLLGMVQAATSINEQTLTFVPKLIVAAICLAIFGGSILVLLTDFDSLYSGDPRTDDRDVERLGHAPSSTCARKASIASIARSRTASVSRRIS